MNTHRIISNLTGDISHYRMPNDFEYAKEYTIPHISYSYGFPIPDETLISTDIDTENGRVTTIHELRNYGIPAGFKKRIYVCEGHKLILISEISGAIHPSVIHFDDGSQHEIR